MAFGHGLQDAQKTMGVIVLALVTYGSQSDFDVPLWVKLSARPRAISLGTYSGGWRIMRTLGRRIIELDPPRGFAAETTAAAVLYTTAFVFAVPVSTTHAITSRSWASGRTRRLSAVRWGVARTIVDGLGADHPGGGAGRGRVLRAVQAGRAVAGPIEPGQDPTTGPSRRCSSATCPSSARRPGAVSDSHVRWREATTALRSRT